MTRTALGPALLSLALASALACGARTRLSGVWRSDGATAPMALVLVVGVARTETARRSFEDHLARELETRGTEAVASHRVLPGSGRLAEADLRRVVREGGFDGVLLTRLLAVDEETTYVPPQTSVSMGAGGGFYRHYGMAYGVSVSPGYLQTTTIVRLETRLYESRDAALVWSAQSDTFDPSSVDDTISSVSAALIDQLEKDGYLRP